MWKLLLQFFSITLNWIAELPSNSESECGRYLFYLSCLSVKWRGGHFWFCMCTVLSWCIEPSLVFLILFLVIFFSLISQCFIFFYLVSLMLLLISSDIHIFLFLPVYCILYCDLQNIDFQMRLFAGTVCKKTQITLVVVLEQ